MRRLILLALALLLIASGGSQAAGDLHLGVTGNVDRFGDLTGQAPDVHQAFLGWGQGETYGAPFKDLLPLFGPVPMLHLGTAAKPPSKLEAITPAAIAAGKGDSYLIALNQAIGDWKKLIYIRPMAEMNNPINLYSYEGHPDPAHSPAAYRNAFCRIFTILHGGTAVELDARLRSLGLNRIGRDLDLPVNPYPGVLRVIWSPLAGLEKSAEPAARYYPGDGCVDMIGNDMYTSSVGGGSFAENEALYRAHPNKPYSLPEWGLENVDDPGFVQKICDFARSRPRVEMLAYFAGKPSSIYDLGDKPKSAAAYRACLAPLGSGLPPPGQASVQPTGTVLIKVRNKFVPLKAFRQVPLGTELDTTKGKVQITSSDGSRGAFYQGRFKLTQEIDKPGGTLKPRKVTTITLTGGSFAVCTARAATGVTKPKPKSVRHVWGSAKGAFRTKGRYASATVRGTLWRVDDRCDGTLITVQRGRVDVFDLVKGKHVLVRAGRTYLIKRPG